MVGADYAPLILTLVFDKTQEDYEGIDLLPFAIDSPGIDIEQKIILIR